MSQETSVWLNTMTLIGQTAQRGNAWHYWADDQGAETNHYEGFIPVDDINRRLYDWEAVARRVAVEVPATFETMTHLGPDDAPMRWDVQADRQAICADDTHETMGLFKSGYQAHQYRQWLLEGPATLLDDGELGISSAGLLKNRAVSWVEVSVPETILGPGGIAFRPNLLACTSFDGSLATTFKRSSTFTVCDNTLTAALSEKGGVFKARHSKNSTGVLKIAEAREALAIIHTMADDLSKELDALLTKSVSNLQFRQVLDVLVPTSDDDSKIAQTKATNKRDKLTGLYFTDPRVAPWTGTAFGVLQAFNTWEHHVKATRGDTKRVERNMMSALDGTTDAADLAVLRVLSAL